MWGNPLTTSEQVQQPFRYSGEFYDSTTGLQFLKARWYDPSVGRFINQDMYEGDLNNPLSLNLYTYVQNNPLSMKDPTGHVGEFLEMAEIEAETEEEAALAEARATAMAYAEEDVANEMALTGGLAGAMSFETTAMQIAEEEAAAPAPVYVPTVDPNAEFEASMSRVNASIAETDTWLAADKAREEAFQQSVADMNASSQKLIDQINSKGVSYPDVDVEGYGKVPFPEGPYEPNNTSLRSSFTPSYKQQFQQWWTDQGRPWPEGNVNIHHIKPLSKGGDNSFENLVPLVQPDEHQPFTNWWRSYP
jgi:RHS repeat-associated protein